MATAEMPVSATTMGKTRSGSHGLCTLHTGAGSPTMLTTIEPASAAHHKKGIQIGGWSDSHSSGSGPAWDLEALTAGLCPPHGSSACCQDRRLSSDLMVSYRYTHTEADQRLLAHLRAAVCSVPGVRLPRRPL